MTEPTDAQRETAERVMAAMEAEHELPFGMFESHLYDHGQHQYARTMVVNAYAAALADEAAAAYAACIRAVCGLCSDGDEPMYYDGEVVHSNGDECRAGGIWCLLVNPDAWDAVAALLQKEADHA